MSIRSNQFSPPLIAFALAFPLPALAQSPPDDIVGPLLEEAEEAYRLEEAPPERPADCPEPTGDEILVCAPVEGDPDRYRVTSRLDKGDDSHLSWSGQAPNVAGEGIFTGPATVSGLCVIPPCPKDPVYYIDVAALPEAPPGSDADRIARGLAPRGDRYDGGAALVATIESEESPPEGSDDPATAPSESSETPEE